MSGRLQELELPITLSTSKPKGGYPVEVSVDANTLQDSLMVTEQAERSNDWAKRHSKRLRKNTPETKAKVVKSTAGSDVHGGNRDQSENANDFETRSSQNHPDYKKMLLSKYDIKMLLKEFGRSHTDFETACKNICCHILNQNPKIKDAWPSYNSNDETSIVFVLVYDSIDDLEADCNVNYDYIKRLRCQKSVEEKLISEYMESNDVSLSDEESKKIDLSMDKHAVNLMKRHKFLSIISKSAVRSRKNGSKIHQEPCMALYVHTKSCIPIDEDPFEKQYDGVPVDVREGTFTLYNNPPEAYQDNLTIGCQIGNKRAKGTLGGFFEHPKYGLCGITAAHVLFTVSDLQVLAEGRGKQEMDKFGSQRFVYQPADTTSKIGRAVTVVHKEGGNDETGIDAAIFTIEERPPLSGKPAGTQAQSDCFESGQIFESSWIHTGKDAIKFGYKTSKTQAKFAKHLDKVSVKVVDGTMQKFTITMYNQIAVKSEDFAAMGDSGSLVFTRLFDGRLACVGLLVSGTPDGLVVITPITPILREFGVTSLKNLMIDKNAHEISILQDKVDRGFDSVNEKLDKLLETRNKINK